MAQHLVYVSTSAPSSLKPSDKIWSKLFPPCWARAGGTAMSARFHIKSGQKVCRVKARVRIKPGAVLPLGCFVLKATGFPTVVCCFKVKPVALLCLLLVNRLLWQVTPDRSPAIVLPFGESGQRLTFLLVAG